MLALRAVDTDGTPAAPPAALADRDADVRRCVRELGARIDADAVLGLWERFRAARPHEGAGRWIHGDLLLGMLAKQPEDRPTLDEITQVLSAVRTALATPAKAPASRPSWFQLAVLPTRPPIDVLGRAAVVMPGGLRHQLLGAALALAVAAATLSTLI